MAYATAAELNAAIRGSNTIRTDLVEFPEWGTDGVTIGVRSVTSRQMEELRVAHSDENELGSNLIALCVVHPDTGERVFTSAAEVDELRGSQNVAVFARLDNAVARMLSPDGDRDAVGNGS